MTPTNVPQEPMPMLRKMKKLIIGIEVIGGAAALALALWFVLSR